LFEGLTVLDEKSAQAVPGVAERWEVSSDGLTYTFHLRPNAKWSTGDRVTAGDFAYSFRRSLTPTLGSTYSYMLWPIKNAEAYNAGKLRDFSAVGVRVVDDLTLQVTLERPTAYLPALAAHNTWFPVRRETIEKFGKLDSRESAWTRPGNLVGNGAFVLEEWKPNARIVVAKNPHYWRAADNRIDRVHFFPIEKPDDEERAFRAGQLHVTNSLPAPKIAAYRKESPLLLRVEPQLNTVYVSFNVTKPPMDNVKVRRALALALDRKAIATRIYESTSQPAYTFVSSACGGYTPPAGQPEDLAAARTLLAEAGFPGGKGFPVVALQTSNDEKGPKTAEVMQAVWLRELGVRTTIEPYEEKTLLQNAQTLTHTISLLGWMADYPDPYTFLEIFRKGGGNNWSGWASKEYDALLDEAGAATDPLKRFALLQRAESILLAEAPIAPFVFLSQTNLVHAAVRNWEPSPLGLHRYQQIRLEP
jgi:oligopeptide transport system substrate-binding protein